MNYQARWFMDMWLEADPIGTDPQTGILIFYGDSTEICCLLTDQPDPIPF